VGRGGGFGFELLRGEEVRPALALAAGGAELYFDGVGVAADVGDFLGGEDVDLDGEGSLGAAGPGLEDAGGGGAVPGGDVRGDGEAGLGDGLGGEEVVLKEQDEGELGGGPGTGGDVADAYTEDLGGVVLLQEAGGATAPDGIVEGALGGFFGLDGSAQDGGVADAAGEVDDGGGVRERELVAPLLQMDGRLVFERVRDGDGGGVLDDLRRQFGRGRWKEHVVDLSSTNLEFRLWSRRKDWILPSIVLHVVVDVICADSVEFRWLREILVVLEEKRRNRLPWIPSEREAWEPLETRHSGVVLEGGMTLSSKELLRLIKVS